MCVCFCVCVCVCFYACVCVCVCVCVPCLKLKVATLNELLSTKHNVFDIFNFRNTFNFWRGYPLVCLFYANCKILYIFAD